MYQEVREVLADSPRGPLDPPETDRTDRQAQEDVNLLLDDEAIPMPKGTKLTGSPSMPRPHGKSGFQEERQPLGVAGAAAATASVRVHEIGDPQRGYDSFLNS